MRNKILQITRNTIPYVKELRPLAGSVFSCIVMQQLDYWFAKYPAGFYKFLEPSPNSALYEEGKSWTEELGCSAEEFLAAFEKIGVRYKSKSAYVEVPDKFGDKFYCSYYERRERLTWYFRNHELLDGELDRLIGGAPEVGDGECERPADGAIPRNRQTRFLRNRRTRFLGYRDSRDGETDTPGFSETSRPGFSYRTEITQTETTRDHTQTSRAPANNPTADARAASECVSRQPTLEDWLRHVDELIAGNRKIDSREGLALSLYERGKADPEVRKLLAAPATRGSQVEERQRKEHAAENRHPPDCSGCYGAGMKVMPGKGPRRCTHDSTSEEARLTPGQIAEQAALIRELLDGGYTPERAEAQFSRSFHDLDWALIMAACTPI